MDFMDTVVSDVLRDFLFSLKQPHWNFEAGGGDLNDVLDELRETKKRRHCDLNEVCESWNMYLCVCV
jgi:hypothetical protein